MFGKEADHEQEKQEKTVLWKTNTQRFHLEMRFFSSDNPICHVTEFISYQEPSSPIPPVTISWSSSAKQWDITISRCAADVSSNCSIWVQMALSKEKWGHESSYWSTKKNTGAILSICTTLQGTNMSHLGKRKIIFKSDFWWDMLIPRRVVV